MNLQHETTLLVRLSEIVSFAEYLPMEMIAQRNTEPKYPVTVGELLASYALDIVLRYEWKVPENEYIVEPLLDALNTLDTGVDQPKARGALFEANSELKKYLDSKELGI